MNPGPARIPAEERIPVREKIAIGLANCTDWIASGAVLNNLLVPFYTVGLGFSPALLGLAQVVWRLWDAFTDPLMGHISDNTRGRWGRRRPYIILGAVLVAFLYPLIWRPPEGLSEQGLFLWLCVFGAVYYTCFTVWSMPYYGLQMELTPNYDERTRLASWIMVIAKLSGLALGWLPWLVASEYFANPDTGKPDIVNGTLQVSWFIAGLILTLGVLPGLFVRERFKAKPRGSEVPGESKPRQSFWAAMRDSATCRPLWALIGVSFLFVFGNGCIAMIGQFTVIYYVCEGDMALYGKIAGVKSSVMVVAGLVSIPLWNWVAEKLDKRRALVLLMSCGVLGHLSNYFLMTPEMPYLTVVSGVLEAIPFSALWLLLPSLKADIADYDELATGRRREANLNAFYSWFFKAAMTASAGVGGFVAVLSGYDAKASQQSEIVLSRMFMTYLWLPVVVWIGAIYCLRFYTLSRTRMNEIRAELTRRRGEPRITPASATP